MISNTPVPFLEAVRHLASKGLMPTGLDSAGLRTIAAGIRRQSVFSAETMLGGYLQEIKDVVASVVEPKQETRYDDEGRPLPQTVTVGLNPATAREALRNKLKELGYAPEVGKEGTIKDLSSAGRIDLVVKTNVELAQGAGKYVQGNANADVVDLWPAWELVRYEDKAKPRDWKMRWTLAAQVSGDAKAAAAMVLHGRMCALKSSGIWQALGDGEGGYDDTLGNPFPPFAFNSGMWTEDVDRDTAVELGLIGENEPAKPAGLDLGSLFGVPEE